MNKVNSLYQETVRMQEIVCGLLFSIFSFVYLYVFQSDVLEALHFSLAHGKTHFSALGSAIVMTLCLILLRWGINWLVGLKNQFISLTYLPSFMVLMAITDIGRDVYTQNTHNFWLWMLPISLGFFLGGIILYKKKTSMPSLTSSDPKLVNLNNNIMFMLLCSFATPLVGNTNTQFHHELQIERCLRENDYKEAMNVGFKSIEASRTLTVLRSFTLSHNGLIGEKLFTYPQYYRSEGLFFANDSLSVLRYTNDSIYQFLGSRPYNGENKLHFLSKICYEGTGKYTALNYYLSALLLEKELDTFATAISDFYDKEDSLPLHYREALVLYSEMNPDSFCLHRDSNLIVKFTNYRNKQKELTSDSEKSSLMRREYGDTYWWYYQYQH